MINNVTLMGRLTSDPELRQTINGISTCKFNIAVDQDHISQGQERQPDFIPIVAWRNTAEFICRNFHKGKMIGIVGKLRTYSYDDKRYPDVKHYVMEVLADSVTFCGDKTSSDNKFTPPVDKRETTSAEANTLIESVEDFEEVIGGSELPF